MKNIKDEKCRPFCCGLIVAAMLILTTPTTRAATMTGPQLATTVMMAAIFGNGVFLGANFGPDANNPLQFVTNVNSTVFSYTMGGTYSGQGLTVNGSGNFTNGAWNYTSSTQLGPISWTVTGSEFIIPNAAGGYDVQTNQFLLPGPMGPNVNDLHYNGFWNIGGPTRSWTFLGSCQNTKDGNNVGNPFFCNGLSGSEDFNNYLQVGVFSGGVGFDTGIVLQLLGSSPLNGGGGQFTMTIGAVPEPSALYLVGAGMVGILGFRRKWFGQPAKRDR